MDILFIKYLKFLAILYQVGGVSCENISYELFKNQISAEFVDSAVTLTKN